MPILGSGIPVVTEPPTQVVDDSYLDSRTLALRSLDGADLLPFSGSEFILQWGLQGLDVPPRDVALEQIPGMDGARITDVKIGPRTPFLPIWFGSDSTHLAYLDKRDGLRSLFNHRGVDLARHDGTFDLVANSRDGQQERTLRCLYQSGMDGDWTRDSSGVYWESVGLNLIAARTYWYGAPWTTTPIRVPAGVDWFGIFPGELSSSQALGAGIPITVTGDVPSWVQVDLIGPATSVTISAPGLNVSIPGGLGAGEAARIVSDPRGRAAIFGGAQDWSRVGPSTRWRALPVGDTTVDVVVPGATSQTTAVISGDSRYESPW